MKFDDLDSSMRIFETSHDHCVLPGIFMVARLDGRSFTKLTKETLKFEAPFDEKFRDAMVKTTSHLMDCGFRTLFGYTQSDEISILFNREEESFSRKLRKLNSVLAGEASALFSLELSHRGCFDCRISQLPTAQDVVDYFRWRSEDAQRNALNAHCYWLLRKQGWSGKRASHHLEKKSIEEKKNLLSENGTDFDTLPGWQRRGTGITWENYQKTGRNPVTDEEVTTTRRKLAINYDLPQGDDYGEFIHSLVKPSEPISGVFPSP